MKIKMLPWFLFFILFLQIVLRSACETTFTPASDAGSGLSENTGKEDYEGTDVEIEMHDETRERKIKEVKLVDKKFPKGNRGRRNVRKGNRGISNRYKPRRNGASTSLAYPSLVIGVVLQVSVGLLPVFSYFI